MREEDKIDIRTYFKESVEEIDGDMKRIREFVQEILDNPKSYYKEGNAVTKIEKIKGMMEFLSDNLHTL